jgi:hypothetical protein
MKQGIPNGDNLPAPDKSKLIPSRASIEVTPRSMPVSSVYAFRRVRHGGQIPTLHPSEKDLRGRNQKQGSQLGSTSAWLRRDRIRIRFSQTPSRHFPCLRLTRASSIGSTAPDRLYHDTQIPCINQAVLIAVLSVSNGSETLVDKRQSLDLKFAPSQNSTRFPQHAIGWVSVGDSAAPESGFKP